MVKVLRYLSHFSYSFSLMLWLDKTPRLELIIVLIGYLAWRFSKRIFFLLCFYSKDWIPKMNSLFNFVIFYFCLLGYLLLLEILPYVLLLS